MAVVVDGATRGDHVLSLCHRPVTLGRGNQWWDAATAVMCWCAAIVHWPSWDAVFCGSATSVFESYLGVASTAGGAVICNSSGGGGVQGGRRDRRHGVFHCW